MKKKKQREQHANACIQCKDSGGDNDGPMYKWSSDGKCIYTSLRECQVANGPPVVASHDDFEKMHRDLPLRYRDRWDATRFEQLARERVSHSAGKVLDQHGMEKHGLPPLQKNEFAGIASETGTMIDGWTPTIIEQGAFKNTLADATQRNRVKVLFEHHHLIGAPTHMEENDTGLLVVGRVSQTVQGIEVMQLLRDGVLDEMSIGWDPVVSTFREVDDDLVRHVHELQLWEFSPVTFGANPGAKISVVNSLRGINDETDELLEKVLHAMDGHCCGGCADGGGCEGEKNTTVAVEIALVDQGVLTLSSSILDRVRAGVTPEERQALRGVLSMITRTLDPESKPAPVTQNSSEPSKSHDATLAALESLAQ